MTVSSWSLVILRPYSSLLDRTVTLKINDQISVKDFKDYLDDYIVDIIKY